MENVREANDRSNLINSAIVFALRSCSALLTLGMQVFLARIMMQDAYGTYLLAWTWLLLLVNFCGFGFADSALRFVPRYHARGRTQDLRSYLSFGLLVTLIGSFVISGILALALLALPVGSATFYVVAVLAACIPFFTLEYFLIGVSRGFGWYVFATAPTYILRPLIIIGGTGLGVLAGAQIGVWTAGLVLFVSVAGVSLVFLLCVLVRLKSTSGKAERYVSKNRKLLWVRASLPLLVVSGFDDLLTYSDVVLLGIMASPEEVALYFAAARTMALASFVHYALYVVAGRGFSLAAAGNDRALLQDRILRSTRLTVWSTVAAVTLTLLAGRFVLSMFGPEFAGGFIVMVILAVGFVLKSMSGQAADLLVVMGHAKANIVIGIGALLFNVVLSVALIPLFGIAGAAAATAITMGLRSLGAIRYAWTLEQLRVFDLRLPQLYVGRSNEADRPA